MFNITLISEPKHSISYDSVNILPQNYKLNVDLPTQSAKESQRSVTYYFDGKKIELSQREALCLQYLMQGMTAKQTAKALGNSPRTIESHLEKIRYKTHCANKLILMCKMRISSE